MKGIYKILILNQLSSESMTGYALMKRLSEYCDKMPSTGTIYPLLDNLVRDKLIKKKKISKGFEYQITDGGNVLYLKLLKEREESLLKSLEIFSELLDTKISNTKSFKEEIDSTQNYFFKYFQHWCEIRELVIETLRNEDFEKKEKDFLKIIRSFKKDLERLKSKK